MSEEFHADGVVETHGHGDAQSFAVTLVDHGGRRLKIALAPVAVSALAKALSDCATALEGPIATKRPQDFAVGSGRYEPVVLVRFDLETPYALSPEDALQLGEALIDEAEEAALRPQPLRQ